MPVDVDTVLVPVDATDRSERAVEYAVEVAARYDASLHVLHVLEEGVVRGLARGRLDPEAVANQQRAFMKVVHETVRDCSDDVPVTQSATAGFSVSELSRNPVTAVLDGADDVDADFIVIERGDDRSEDPGVLGRVSQHLLSYASEPVLSV
ncbi:universal stress protein [Halococcoides cellulosivorans]|uniref:Universal stress protein UspA n=1 Tax=Halococcoides cellulosivorans TaxID=1679096 RepID=A0A2R4X4H8_9EURY|nr:universal stress protein [Halococcoides cellulosivorans]AWB28701.1 universal stress protein UspA [Halococcoides cellulosivorans]